MKLNYLTTALVLAAAVLASSADAQVQTRYYYITPKEFTGDQALTACAEGYHMASVAELQDPSNLVYDVEANLTGFNSTTHDVGHGVIIKLDGWARTSFTQSYEDGNCETWRSANPDHLGLVLRLITPGSGPVVPSSQLPQHEEWYLRWIGAVAPCDSAIRVHCVSDPVKPIQPEIMYCNGFENGSSASTNSE